MAEADEKYQVPAVVAAIKVLRELAKLPEPGATLSSLVEITGISKSTMHKLLATLALNDFVRRDADTRMYCLGPALIPLGAAASEQVKLLGSAIEMVAPLAGELGLSFAVAQRTASLEVQIIDRFYPPSGVHVGINIGSTYGPLDGALGKILLAGLDADQAREIIKSGSLPAHTRSTITNPGPLLEEVDRAREAGWAASRGELNANYAVAAGIRGQSGELELLLLALGFPAQLDDSRLDEVGEMLVDIADRVMNDAGVPPVVPPLV